MSGYLAELGISHLYLSPILEARPGSDHGYDTIDPTRVSDERGGEEGFARLAARIERGRDGGRGGGLEGLILDVVPNHVAASWRNPAWWDVLAKGAKSRHWASFDFRSGSASASASKRTSTNTNTRTRDSDSSNSKIVLPVLGRSRAACVASRELHFDFFSLPTSAHDGLVIRYWDHLFPVATRAYPAILRALAAELNEDSGRARAWRKRLERWGAKAPESFRDSDARSVAAWFANDAVVERVLRLSLRVLPLKVLEAALEEQPYRLEDWRTGSREINYRRFFDINDLAAVRMEDPFTFRWTHGKLGELARKYPVIHGLRIDHVDGLTDPEAYLKKVRSISRHVWVEKILGEGERVPSRWPIAGTTGYEFLGSSARLFVDLPGLQHLHGHYTRHIDRRWERFHECVYDSKLEMLESHFVSELAHLSAAFYRLASGRRGPGFTEEELKIALRELTSSLRVYRTYSTPGSGSHWLEQAFAEAEGRGRVTSKAALDWLRSILFGTGGWSEETYELVKRWEQLTGPVMAKGLEDTALYRYFPLLSLNVVGGEPDWTGDGAIEFHAFNQERLRSQPLTMSTTSTHDTKRSEDVRSRIHVLSETSEEWTSLFEAWHRQNRDQNQSQNQSQNQNLAVEYLIYETLLGAWPHDGRITDAFIARMKRYFLKAAREAKSETSWMEPDPSYEERLMDFVEGLLMNARAGRSEFSRSFTAFAAKCSYFGAFNSLSLLALKVFSPGLPDFYQGCELWDLSLVDPDNRRSVDYELRRRLLKDMKRGLREDSKGYRERVLRDWKSGEVKLWLTWELLRLRRRDPELFTRGEYLALEPAGPMRRHFVGFMRCLEDRCALVLVPRFLASSEESSDLLRIKASDLLETRIQLPSAVASVRWRQALTGSAVGSDMATGIDSREDSRRRSGERSSVGLRVGDVLDGLPVGVLVGVMR